MAKIKQLLSIAKEESVLISKNRGFGLIETIVALGIFSVIITGGLTSFVSSLNSNRLSEEHTQATLLAQEGIEALRSLQARNFTNLIPGTYGIGISSNLWVLSGTSDTTGKFIRDLTISTANRDTGNTLISVGGSTDPDTVSINSRVTWPYSTGITNSVVFTSYLSNWRKSLGNSNDGLIVYSDGTTLPKWRSYTNASNAFSTESNSLTTINGASYKTAVSPNKMEAVTAYTNSAGQLTVLCYDGSNWSQEWTTTVGGTSTTRRFDVAYETNTGDAIVAYSNNVATTNEVGFRTKSGSSGCGSGNWSGATNFDPTRTTGTVQWLKLTSDNRSSSNLIAMLWADSNADLSAAIWNGTTFVNEPAAASETSLEVVTTAQDVDDFDMAYESTSGDLMVVWANSVGANGTNGVRYRTCTGGISTCTWNAVTTPPTFSDDATTLSLSANPNSDEMVFASIGNAGSDLQVGYWSGSAWTNTANVDTSSATPAAGRKLVATGWLISGATTRSVVAYNDRTATNVGWYIGNAGTFTLQTDFTPTPAFNATQTWYEIENDPKNKDRLLLLVADNASDVFAKRLVMTSAPAFTWTNADGGTALETTLTQATNSPYSYSYWRN